MGGDKAKFTFELEGADTAAKKAKDLAKEMDKIKGAAKDAFSGLTGIPLDTAGLIQSGAALANAAVQQLKAYNSAVANTPDIDYKNQRDAAAKFEESLTRLSFKGHQSFDTLEKDVKSVSQNFGIAPDKVLGMAEAFTAVTLNADNSVLAVQSIAEEAGKTGRTVQELMPIATTLSSVFKYSAEEIKQGFQDIEVAAKNVSTVGGAMGLQKQLEAGSSALSNFHMSTEKQRMTALTVASAAGASHLGLNPREAQQATQQLFSGLASMNSEKFGKKYGGELWTKLYHDGKFDPTALPEVLHQLQIQTTKHAKAMGRRPDEFLAQYFGNLGAQVIIKTPWQRLMTGEAVPGQYQYPGIDNMINMSRNQNFTPMQQRSYYNTLSGTNAKIENLDFLEDIEHGKRILRKGENVQAGLQNNMDAGNYLDARYAMRSSGTLDTILGAPFRFIATTFPGQSIDENASREQRANFLNQNLLNTESPVKAAQEFANALSSGKPLTVQLAPMDRKLLIGDKDTSTPKAAPAN